jgi:predicted nucleic acid-binding protein
MKRYVYDAGAPGLLLAGDSRLKSFVAEASRGHASAHTNVVNLAKFYYKTGQKLGLETAETWFLRIVNSNIQVEVPDVDLARDAGTYRIHYRQNLSLADCFAAAEAARRRAVLFTTDEDLNKVKEIEARYFKA